MSPDFSDYLEFQKKRGLAVLTIKGYHSDLNQFARWFNEKVGQEVTPQLLQSEHVFGYRQYMINKGDKPQTINRKLAAIISYGWWAVKTKQITINPAEGIKNMAETTLAPKWLDKRQKSAIMRTLRREIEEAKDQYPRLWLLRLRDSVAVSLILNTGIRLSEVCDLKLDDVKISERKGNIIIRQGKGQKRRIIPLNNDGRGLLLMWLNHRPKNKGDMLFTGQRGEGMNPRAVQRAVHRIAKKAKVENATPHTLRHTFAKTLLDENVPIDQVALLLGHSNLNTTRIYTTPDEKDLEKAVGKINENRETLGADMNTYQQLQF